MNTVTLSRKIIRATERKAQNLSSSFDHKFRSVTSSLRVLPSFLVIGTAKGGTTSLHRYLEEHPNIGTTLKKEVHFFDYNFNLGLDWYKTYFPLRQSNLLAVDSTPNYLLHPHVPRRVYETLPEVKLILLLRNPIDRAYSHHNMNVKRIDIQENLSFEDAIKAESARIQQELLRVQNDEDYTSMNLSYYSYLASGIYVDQINTWLRYFSLDQMLILKSEDFFKTPSVTYTRVLEFLQLPPYALKEYTNANPRDYSSDMNPETRKYLANYFKPYNEKLYRLLGVDYAWN